MSEFVDTNILVYAHDTSAGPKHTRAIELISCLATEATGVLSTQVLCEFYSVMTRKLRVPGDAVEPILADLGKWHVHRPTVADILSATNLCSEHKLSWWDSLIVTSAQATGCTTLWSEDLSTGSVFGNLTIRSPWA